MDEGPLCASLVPAQVRERKWRRALPQRRGRAGGWPQGRGGRLPRSPHPQPPRSFSAPGTQGRRGPAPLGGARQRWLRPRDWCPASRVASPPGHDGSRRLAGSSALGLWARPLPSGPLGAVRTSARRRFAPLCLRPAQSPAHLLGSGETEMGGGGRVGATRIEGWERSAWGGWDRSLGADRPQRREGSPRASEPVAADAPAWAGDGPSPGGCGLQMAEPHSHLLREVRMPPLQGSVCRAGALVAAGAPCLSFPRRAASPRRPRPPGAQLHRFDPPEFNRFPSRQMWRPDGLGKQCVWGGSEGRAASKFSRLGGTGLPPASSP